MVLTGTGFQVVFFFSLKHIKALHILVEWYHLKQKKVNCVVMLYDPSYNSQLYKLPNIWKVERSTYVLLQVIPFET